MGNVCAVGTGGTVDERRRDKGRWVQVRRRERNGTEGTEGRGAVGAGTQSGAGLYRRHGQFCPNIKARLPYGSLAAFLSREKS